MPSRILPETYHLQAAAHGLIWLGPEVRGAEIKTTWQCGVGHKFLAPYHSIQRGHGCAYCAGSARKLSGDYVGLAFQNNIIWLGPEVKSTRAKTYWLCTCGYKWRASYNTIQQKSACPDCAGNAVKTVDDYVSLARSKALIWFGVLPKNSQTKTKWKCFNGHQLVSSYNQVDQGRGCPECSKPNEDSYRTLAQDKGFTWLGPMVERVKMISNWECVKGHKWKACYNNIQQGKGCPSCANLISKPEIQLREAIKVIYPDTQGNVRELLSNKRFELDIYIPSLKKAIEYDGWAHTHYKDAPARDARKNRECEEAGIQLLRVKDEDYTKDPQAVISQVLEWLAYV